MGSTPLHYVDLRAFCYATEDERRVEAALRTFLPEEFPIEREEGEGHHGDRIVVLSARVENADDVRTVLDRVGEIDDPGSVLSELEDRVTDDCELFLQFDKGAAYRGEVRLGDGITFRAKVEAYPAKKPAAVEKARDLLASYAE
jgi:RNA binding exosome subunit